MTGKQYQDAAVFENTEAGHQQLAQWLVEQTAQSAHVCLEATGQYGYRVACHLHHLGYYVSIVNPTRIKGFAASLMQRSKSDRIDAKVIAQFCVALEPERWQPPLEEQQDLQELMRRLSAIESILHPGSFHSKERLKQIKALPGFTLSLSHIYKAVVTVQIEGEIAGRGKVVR